MQCDFTEDHCDISSCWRELLIGECGSIRFAREFLKPRYGFAHDLRELMIGECVRIRFAREFLRDDKAACD